MSEPQIDVRLTEDFFARSLEHDVRAGLGAQSKTLPPKWFYDATGSKLFDRITELPEYYQTRTEASILRAHAGEFAELTGAASLVELGSGSSEKTRLLLDALSASATLRDFVPLDVSGSALREAANAIAIDYPGLGVHAVLGDFTAHLEHLPGARPRAVVFLGGTIGNFLPGQRASLLASLAAELHVGEWVLLGTDLVKDPQVIVRAYDDAEGVTAQFNLNVLHVLNRECGADFDVDSFTHRVVWDPENAWIEMRLVAERDMSVRIEKFDMSVHFAEGESLRTEISAKFDRPRIERELYAAGFELASLWTDPDSLFALTLARRMD